MIWIITSVGLGQFLACPVSDPIEINSWSFIRIVQWSREVATVRYRLDTCYCGCNGSDGGSGPGWRTIGAVEFSLIAPTLTKVACMWVRTSLSIKAGGMFWARRSINDAEMAEEGIIATWALPDSMRIYNWERLLVFHFKEFAAISSH